nr:unnamed protein product [Callosobruchus analis]
MRQEMNKRQEITVARVAFSTILLWFVSWTPYAIVALLGVFDQKYLITPLVSMFPALFCKTASCLDAYVYALSHPKFKMELRKLCFRQRDINRKVFALPGDTQRDFKSEGEYYGDASFLVHKVGTKEIAIYSWEAEKVLKQSVLFEVESKIDQNYAFIIMAIILIGITNK